MVPDVTTGSAMSGSQPLQASTTVSFALLALLGLLYAGFMVAAAFAPGLFAGPVVTGGTVSYWFLYGIGLIWGVVLATGLYVLLANAEERAR